MGLRAAGRLAAGGLLVLAIGAGPVSAAGVPGVPGLPDGAPAAATQAEPALPAPGGWPFGESFPRTSGTGRLDTGASYWSDFLYDDHGALGVPLGTLDNASNLAPVRGTYVYPDGPAKRNGADIFRSAVGLDEQASYWRVDFNTLIDPAVPIAEWTFDTDNSAATGAPGGTWPAAAGVRSPGIERALVVSRRGARLLDATTGLPIATFPTTVDTAARSFVVKIPRSTMPVGGNWRVRLAAGLADAAGTAFAPATPAQGALPGQPAVYNVTFRSPEQEAALVCPDGSHPAFDDSHAPASQCGNFWMENDQGQTLAGGDVSKYSEVVDWGALAAKQSTPEPLVRGYSNRWYVSRLDLGQGVVVNEGQGTGDLRPNYLGRVQPYAVYVPKGYDPAKPAPLTWVLHSLGANLNQYGAVAPSQMIEECESRNSICATTEGYGPDNWYFDEGEVDFWQVWRTLADHYALDPDATVISGYSMGGYASYKLALAYADLFAKAMPLEGPPGCGLRLSQSTGSGAGEGHCTDDGDTTALLGNARWLPYVITYGVVDELVPITSGIEQVQAIDKLGYRHYSVIYPTEDHMVFALQNDFVPATRQLGAPRRVIDPGHITFSFYPDLTRADFGIGPTGAYWIRSPVARDKAPGKIARVDAVSHARPDPTVTPVRTNSALAEFHPTPAAVQELTWKLGAAPAAEQRLSLDLTDLASLDVDTARAGFSCGTLETKSDGAVAVRLLELSAGRAVTVAGVNATTTDASGTASLSLPSGSSTAEVACATTAVSTTPNAAPAKPTSSKSAGSRRSSSGSGATAPAAASASGSTGSGSLPFTGAQLAILVALGAALLGAGLLLRRRASQAG